MPNSVILPYIQYEIYSILKNINEMFYILLFLLSL